MRVFTYSEARQKFAELLDLARRGDVLIKRRGGETFVLRYQPPLKSPLDVKCVKTGASLGDILDAIGESRDWPRPTEE